VTADRLNADSKINLEDLTMCYRDRGRAAEATEIMGRVRNATNRIYLDRLLRDHTARPIKSRREIRQRDSFDFLIAFYGILEIASLIRYVPVPLPSAFNTAFLRDLSNSSVKRYYEKYYPLLLPQLCRLRLEGKLSIGEASPDYRVHALFQSFLSIESRQRIDDDVDLFLWFLDDGWSNGYSLSDVVECLLNRSDFLKRILKSPQKQDDLDSAVCGFGKLLSFCNDFDGFLKRCSTWPIFQSALWHYYAYWFDLVGESIGPRLRKIINNFYSWKSEQSSDANQMMREYLDQSRDSIDRLLSGAYGVALRDACQNNVADRKAGYGATQMHRRT
jgi:hypothetical protein